MRENLIERAVQIRGRSGVASAMSAICNQCDTECPDHYHVGATGHAVTYLNHDEMREIARRLGAEEQVRWFDAHPPVSLFQSTEPA